MIRDRQAAVDRIGKALKESGHAEVDVPRDDPDHIAFVRSCGRQAAREQRWRVQTLTADTDGATTRIFIVITQADPMHQRLWDAKRDRTMRRAIQQL